MFADDERISEWRIALVHEKRRNDFITRQASLQILSQGNAEGISLILTERFSEYSAAFQ